MFEKSLYDLIKGLRQHKGNEEEFIEHSLRECRREIRGSDMDLKATALLKLVYLEMFGHDMSWAAFNILEVMSASKQHQKRIGYLGAVQTFGPNTDVLMLATNLLKKDITSSTVSVVSLPLVTIPHIVTPGLANAVVPDLLARIGHSSPNIRKKAIVTIYRLALVWPEALRPAWPKMKDILENDEEDHSVTATVVNIVCELVWRRPEDFLPLAPRFFELLVNGGNNWMAIKLIKLFASLTPLEPRLIKKLTPALTNLINTTPAMSVLYECINGIIQGGILDGAEGIREGDEIAELCVSKLCGMIAVEGDPNLKYVALLAFNKIVLSHPYLVSAQQDTIASCLDDGDISIRMQALSLVSGMVDSENLVPITEKLLAQLETNKSRQLQSVSARKGEGHHFSAVNSEDDLHTNDIRDYGTSIIHSILDMCSRNMYANVADFDWYIDVLVQLVQLSPAIEKHHEKLSESSAAFDGIGEELRNVAVRVKSARTHATEAASNVLAALGQYHILQRPGYGAHSALSYAAWIAGEYPGLLPDAQGTLSSILLQLQQETSAQVVVSFIQAVPKLLGHVFSTELNAWDGQKHATSALLLARLTTAIEPYTAHSNIEVQEYAVTILELTRISEAALTKHAGNELTAPTLIRDILPSLFSGQDLNPVAVSAQSKVPMPSIFDLDAPINPNLTMILREPDVLNDDETVPAAREFYYKRDKMSLQTRGPTNVAVQSADIAQYDEADMDTESTSARFSVEKGSVSERALYDPFYISGASEQITNPSNKMHDIIQDSNGQSLDIDSIPIVELDIKPGLPANGDSAKLSARSQPLKTPESKARVHVTTDETLEGSDVDSVVHTQAKNPRRSKLTRALLQFDSSHIGSLSSSPGTGTMSNESISVAQETGTATEHDHEMKKALAEVERLRLEMQRAQDRVAIADNIPQEGTLVAKRKKDKKKKIKKGKGNKPKKSDELAKQETTQEIQFLDQHDDGRDSETVHQT